MSILRAGACSNSADEAADIPIYAIGEKSANKI